MVLYINSNIIREVVKHLFQVSAVQCQCYTFPLLITMCSSSHSDVCYVQFLVYPLVRPD